MKITLVAIDSIKPYENNAKLHPQSQLDKLAKEISDVGFTQPIVVDSKNIVVCGHGRLQAALQLKLEKVPVFKLPADISENRIKAMRLFDNKIGETGWDQELLSGELSAIELSDIDFTLTGFDEIPAFIPDLPDDEQENEGEKEEFVLRITFDCDDERTRIFNELKGRGYRVKV